jgi:hypothetical protein
MRPFACCLFGSYLTAVAVGVAPMQGHAAETPAHPAPVAPPPFVVAQPSPAIGILQATAAIVLGIPPACAAVLMVLKAVKSKPDAEQKPPSP